MRKLRKKALALFLTVMMVAAMAPAAFAGTFSDVPADNQYAGAIDRLAGFGVVQGFPDGTFQPSGTFTRAQAAAIAVRLRGISSGAGQGETQFSDVPADHWASGWINLAVGLGIIQGYPDGTFKPENPVTHAEWLAMVLRVLGYGPQVNKMPWPAGVVAKAALLGLDKNVSITPNLPASRAEVAAIADNALTAEIVDCGFDAEGNPTSCTPQAGKTVAKTYLKATTEPASGTAMLTASPELFDNPSDQVTIGTTNKTLAGANYKGLLGHQVVAWLNSDGKVFFLEDRTPADKIKTAEVDTTANTIKIDNKDVTLASEWKLFKNFTAVPTTGTSNSVAVATYIDPARVNTLTGVDNGEVTVILDDNGKVAAIIAQRFNRGVVDNVSTAYNQITFKDGTVLSLKDTNATWVGAASKLEDVNKDDVVEYVKGAAAGSDGKYPAYIVVTRNAKTGTYSKLSGTKVTVGGTEYKTDGISTDDLTGLLGKDVTILLDRFGRAVSMKAATGEAASTMAIAVEAPYQVTTADGTAYYLHLMKGDGTQVRLRVADKYTLGSGTTEYEASNITSVVAAVYGVEYKTNANGQINNLTVYDAAPVARAVYKDPNRIFDGTSYVSIAPDTAIFDASNPSDIKTLSAAKLVADSDNSVTARVVSKDGKATLIIVTAGLVASGTDTWGMILSAYQTGDNKNYYSINVKGTTTDYEVGATVFDSTYADKVVKFQPVAGSATAVTYPTADIVSDATYTARVKAIDLNANVLTVERRSDAGDVDQTKTYILTPDTVVYDLNGSNPAVYSSLQNLAVGTKVQVFVKGTGSEANVATVILIDQ